MRICYSLWKQVLISIKIKFIKKNLTTFNYGIFTATNQILEAINGYDIQDETWYLQIYVPFDDEVDLSTIPTIAVGDIDTEDDVILGYKLNTDGTVQAILVDETYARHNLTWVISVNESVNNDGELASNSFNEEDGSLMKVPDLYVGISGIKITDKKEKWLQGRADVTLIGYQINNNNNCQISGDNIYFDNFIRIKKNQLNTWIYHPTRLLVDNTKILDPNEEVLFVIYELDRSANSIVATFPTVCNNVTRVISYNSNDSYYGKWSYGPTFFNGYGSFSSVAQKQILTYGNEEFEFKSYEK